MWHGRSITVAPGRVGLEHWLRLALPPASVALEGPRGGVDVDGPEGVAQGRVGQDSSRGCEGLEMVIRAPCHAPLLGGYALFRRANTRGVESPVAGRVPHDL